MKDFAKKGSLLLFVFFIAAFFDARLARADVDIVLQPSTGSIKSESIVPLGVFISSPNNAVNAASGIITFPADHFEVMSLDDTNTIFSFWVEQPSFDNELGIVRFGGVSLGDSFQGVNGRVLTIRFRAKQSGPAEIKFDSSLVLAADGYGTEIPTNELGAAFDIVKSMSKSDEGKITIQDAGIKKDDNSFEVAVSIVFLAILATLAIVVLRLKKLEKLNDEKEEKDRSGL